MKIKDKAGAALAGFLLAASIFTPSFAGAQTTDPSVIAALQAQINALLAQVSSLKAQLNAVSKPVAPSAGVISTLLNGSGPFKVASNAANQKIGSYLLFASTNEMASVSSIGVTTGPMASSTFQSLHITVNGLPFGTTYAVLGDALAYYFSGEKPLFISPGQSAVLDVYADTLFGASGSSVATSFATCAAVGAKSGAVLPCPGPVAGQLVTIGGPAGLACAPTSPTVPVGSPAIFAATGYSGYAYWNTFSGNPSSGSGATFTTYFGSPGIKSVTVYNNGASAQCTVNVVPVTPQQLTCSPANQATSPGTPVSFAASGGTGAYSWTAGNGNPAIGSGANFTTTFLVPGIKTVTVSSGSASAYCVVTVNNSIPTSTPAMPYDSDNSPNYTVFIPSNATPQTYPDLFAKGIGLGIYIGATPGFNLIYGDGWSPPVPPVVTTTNSYSTFYDHCASDRQLNEAYVVPGTGMIGAAGVLAPAGYVCLNGAFALASSVFPKPAFIFTSPAGGEKWQIGKTYVIAWTGDTSSIQALTLVLMRQDGSHEWGLNATLLNPAQREYKWSAGSMENCFGSCTLPPAGEYRLKIEAQLKTDPAGTFSVSATSNLFNLVNGTLSPLPLTVAAPAAASPDSNSQLASVLDSIQALLQQMAFALGF